MTLQTLSGTPMVQIGINPYIARTNPSTAGNVLMDAANEAAIYIGQIFTSDGASHTIDTTGSSSLQWRTGAVTFANAGTTVKVGLAAVDTANGPVGRAVNVADLITFDVSKTLVGTGAGITANAWQTHVPDAGTKTVANGDFIAFCIQMVTRVTDSVQASNSLISANVHRPAVSSFTGGVYANGTSVPNCMIVFNDGATGYFYGGEVFSTLNTRTWNTAGAVDEYGQLYNLPFPTKIYGLYGYGDFDADCNIVLYSDALGTPVAEKTVAIDLNTIASTSGRMFQVLFSPYTYSANTNIAAVFSPGASNISAYYKTLNAAGDRITDPWGTAGYGVERATTGSGAFTNTNSSLDHYYIGLLCGAFDDGASSGLACNPLGGFVV